MSIKITVDKKAYTVDVNPDTPLLWVLRDTLNLTGTKFGCGLRPDHPGAEPGQLYWSAVD